jgi:nitrogen regulatory protein PII
MEKPYYLICFYVPKTHLESVKEALFLEGAGHYQNYDKCCWQTLGHGQFRPLDGSYPHIGKNQQVSLVEEYKVEIICPKEKLEQCLNALKTSHPYEVPAYHVHEVKY